MLSPTGSTIACRTTTCTQEKRFHAFHFMRSLNCKPYFNFILLSLRTVPSGYSDILYFYCIIMQPRWPEIQKISFLKPFGRHFSTHKQPKAQTHACCIYILPRLCGWLLGRAIDSYGTPIRTDGRPFFDLTRFTFSTFLSPPLRLAADFAPFCLWPCFAIQEFCIIY